MKSFQNEVLKIHSHSMFLKRSKSFITKYQTIKTSKIKMQQCAAKFAAFNARKNSFFHFLCQTSLTELGSTELE
jgi:hypothetical protein